MSIYIENQLEKIMKQYRPNSVPDLIEKSNYKVLQVDLDDETGGCTVTNNRCHTIIINAKWDFPQQQFVILHEFSHIKLHKGINTPFFRKLSLDRVVSQTEREANELAIKLLIQINGENLVGMTKYQMLDYLGLPYKFEIFLEVEY